MKKWKVSRELGLAIDAAIEEFGLEGVLDAPKHFDKWSNDCEYLNNIDTFTLAKYIIEGYEYPKTKEELIDEFISWLADYNLNVQYPTKKSSYRKGRRDTLEEIEKKLVDLKLINEINITSGRDGGIHYN
ncbi:hypothetical protein [Siminovitchia sp. 179-K 8D1 HS]|uniref:hypothetical protein n=1 Tax=Siminovitchia sp. 179-K 8D1 HS TaxID=3142385 RepID=UPI0039A1E0D7